MKISKELLLASKALKILNGNLLAIMPIKVGGKCVDQKVYIFQNDLPYNILLGRPWIYNIRAITSMLHQSIKFMHNGKLVTIHT